MNKKLLKKSVSVMVLSIMLVAPIMAMPGLVNAVDIDDLNQGDYVDDLHVSQSNTDLRNVVVNIINWVLGILGLIAVIIIIIAGFEWMTAGGDPDKVASAKKRMQQALIGLAIILAAWLIVSFVLNALIGEIY